MASRAPVAPVAPPAAPTAITAATPPPLADGFVRLSDVRVKRPATDEYAALRPFVGKLIALDNLKFENKTFKRKGKDTTVLTGSMSFREYGTDGPMQTAAVPQAAVKAIVEAVRTNPNQTIVAEVVKLKRGLALR